MKHRISACDLVAESGGSYAAALGINLDELQTDEIYKWFLAAVLYGARISETLATRTWQEFAHHNVLSPQRMLDTGWEGLVKILDAGGYVRYDYKTATKLIEVNRSLLAEYAGSLNALHAAAADSADLEQRIMLLGKGIGPATTDIFLRELRHRWEKAAPLLSPLAFLAAQQLGFLSAKTTPENALHLLQQHWLKEGMPLSTFADFEAALVRNGLRLRRHAALHPL